MGQLFNYNTINVQFDRSTSNVEIQIKKTGNDLFLNQEVIFELETLFNWLCSHLEVQSIFLNSEDQNFFNGFDPQVLQTLNEKEFSKLIDQYQKLIYGLFHIPQTLVVDFGSGAKGAGIELALAADIRIMRDDGELLFDQLENGQVPMCGGIGILSSLIGNAAAKNWLFSGRPITSESAQNCGFISNTYQSSDHTKLTGEIKNTIAKQGPIQRIQAKRCHLEVLMPDLKRAFEYEHEIGKASLTSLDWQEAARAKNQNRESSFVDARFFAHSVKVQKEVKV